MMALCALTAVSPMAFLSPLTAVPPLLMGHAALIVTPPLLLGHAALVTPRSRNSLDYLVGVNTPEHWQSDAGCANISSHSASCHNGQAAFYYSQGCFIGCAECSHGDGRRQVDLCGGGATRTIDPRFRTVNLNSTPGSAEDIYQHNPWAAPGTAPVADACGLAGGTPWLPEVSEAGDYTNGTMLPQGYPTHHGLNGTLLPPMDTGTQWKIGGTAEVTFTIENNHGGGYAYRLCPAGEPLTEECFTRHHLEFDTGAQGIVYKGMGGGAWVAVAGEFVTEGTHPPGSMWAKLPVPSTALGPRCIAGPNDTNTTPFGCEEWEKGLVDGPCKPCPGTAGSDCSRCDNPWDGTPSFPPPCDGCKGSPHDKAVRDVVKVPATLKPGKYVLGWRWDCEATAQVWSNCADVELVA